MTSSQSLRPMLVLLLLLWSSSHSSALLAADDIGLSAYPASLKSNCAPNCGDTLRESYDLTFISRLTFPIGSAMLSRDAQNELLSMLVELESFAVIKHVEIIGHADPSGPEHYNRWITGVRAARVEDHFKQNGVDPRKISTRGAGSSELLTGAIDDSEHRRVEVRITLQPFL